MQKQQALAETTLQIEKGKSQFEMQKMQMKAEIEKQMLELKYGYDIQLKSMEVEIGNNKEKDIEDRKDQRTRIQATQQSKMISQRQNDSAPTNFEQQDDPAGLDMSAFTIT